MSVINLSPKKAEPPPLTLSNGIANAEARSANGGLNKIYPEDRPAHSWYRFVLSYPPHLVREYLNRFELTQDQCVLDPFCGTGTTIVECKKRGIRSVGIERNPMAHFASQVKADWSIDPDELLNHAHELAEAALHELDGEGLGESPVMLLERKQSYPLQTLPVETAKLLLTDSISPLPLHKTLVLLRHLSQKQNSAYFRYELLALANALVFSISNLKFGPEVGVGPKKNDAPVIASWLASIHVIADDLRMLHNQQHTPSTVFHADARQATLVLRPDSINAVITSPPYPNEKDYTRTTRLESVLLGFVNSRDEMQTLKKGLIRSNTRGVYKGDDDDAWVSQHPEIQRIAEEIETRRIALGKTSGFERLYARVTKLYFGGMARHLAEIRGVLRPGAHLAYVVGDQASYLRVMIRTGQLLADIAQSLGYEVIGIDLFRTRLATATKQQMREEVVVLRWPGERSSL